jgi:hypothetical protein
MNRLKSFFLFCAGVDRKTLESCPTDENKYAGIGATVFFTGVMAFISSGYALYTVFDNWFTAILFGILWGMMIFNLDRYIVMSMKSNGKWYRDWAVALPRLALAVILALVISKPLELKIFEKEINAELVQMEQEVFKKQEDLVKDRYTKEIESNQAEIALLKNEINTQTASRDELALRALQEADGTGGSGKRNLGPIYKAKKAEADKAQAELDALIAKNQPIIEEKQQNIQKLEGEILVAVAGLERETYGGMAARMEALSRLSTGSQAIWFASIFITLLFIAIETAPIFVKLISSRSPYDYVLHQREHIFEMENLEKVTLLKNEVGNKLRYDTEIGKHKIQAEIKLQKEIIDHKVREKLDEIKGNCLGGQVLDYGA